jgi:RimJ/RimL family protein N-acetyltransferase
MAAFPARDKATFNAHWSRILADDSLIKQTVLVNDDVAGNLVCFTRFGVQEVGYWLGRAYWGKGVATMALAAFLKGISMRPLHARVAKHNIGSQRVLEKCGFSVAGEEAFMENGREIVELVYILTSDSCGKHS